MFKYMAIVKPIGKATAIAIAAVKKVPETNAKIPKCFSLYNGVHCVSVKNSKIDTLLKKAMLSKRRTAIIPTVVKIVMEAQNFKMNSIIFSLTFIKYNSR